jgi:hypothetical protein
MGKNQSASGLTNIVQYDTAGNISLVSGSTTLLFISSSGAIITTGVISGSNALSASYAVSASNALAAQTASYVQNAQSASYVFTAQTASFVANAQSASNAVAAQTASFASAFTVAGTLTAQTLVVQTITSSVDFVTGSTRFGSILGNTHVFSGSVTMNPGGLFVSSSGNVLIGTTSSTGAINVDTNRANLILGASTSNKITFNNGSTTQTGYVFNSPTETSLGYPSSGTFNIQQVGGENVMTIASTGAATFSNNITMNPNGPATLTIGASNSYGAVSSGGGGAVLYLNGATRGGSTAAASNAVVLATDGDFYISNGAVNSFKMTLESTGAATFSSSITANASIVSNRTKSTSGIESWDGLNLRLFGTNAIGDSINIKFVNNGGTQVANIAGILGGDNVAYGSLSFQTRNYFTDSIVEVMRINNRGNILIGTTTDNGSKLNVNGTSTFESTIGMGNASISWGFENQGIKLSKSGVGPKIALYASSQYLFLGYAESNGWERVYAQATSGGVYLTNGATSWTANSDERLKTINSNIENATDKLSTLRTVKYSWKEDELNREYLGLIAQDVEKVLPELVDKDEKDEIGTLGVRYTEMIPVLVKAIQELKAENDTLKEILQRNNIQ